MPLLLIYVIFYFIVLLLINRNIKTILNKRNSLYKSYSNWDSDKAPNIIFLITSLITVFLIVYFRFLFKDFIENYIFMSKNYMDIYFNNSLELFNISKLDILIKSLLLEDRNLKEALDIVGYKRSIIGCINYLNLIFLGFIIPLGILNSRYETVNNDGIYFKNFLIKWKNIESYEWFELKETKTVNYYVLNIKVSEKRFLNFLFKKISLKICEKDFYEIDKFLSEKLNFSKTSI